MTTRQQMRILWDALGALVCGAGLGMCFGFGDYAGRVWYDLQSGIMGAAVLGTAFFVAVVVQAIIEGGEQ